MTLSSRACLFSRVENDTKMYPSPHCHRTGPRDLESCGPVKSDDLEEVGCGATLGMSSEVRKVLLECLQQDDMWQMMAKFNIESKCTHSVLFCSLIKSKTPPNPLLFVLSFRKKFLFVNNLIVNSCHVCNKIRI